MADTMSKILQAHTSTMTSDAPPIAGNALDIAKSKLEALERNEQHHPRIAFLVFYVLDDLFFSEIGQSLFSRIDCVQVVNMINESYIQVSVNLNNPECEQELVKILPEKLKPLVHIDFGSRMQVSQQVLNAASIKRKKYVTEKKMANWWNPIRFFEIC